MADDELKIDKSSREKIRTYIDKNYFVEAGAGSGKTTILVDRMVKMIEEDIDISLISAITFTKAAANEFYERFQKKLIEESLKNNKYKTKYLNALQNIDLAFMGTIDAFCNMIMSEHPSEGLIPSNSRVIDYDTSQEIYKREYANIQNGLYEDDNLTKDSELFLKYNDHQEETFVLTLNALLAHRDSKIVIPEIKDINLDEKYQDEIKTIRKIIDVLSLHPEYIIASNEETSEKLRKAIRQSRNTFNSAWDNNIPNILNAFAHTFLNSSFRLSVDPKVENDLKEGIDYFINNPGRGAWLIVNPDRIPKIVEEIEENRYAITLNFVNSAKDKILLNLKKEGLLTFNDYLVYLRDTLKKDAKSGGKLIKHISDRHKYFLIDEFQDTDPIQAEIFFYLASKEVKENWCDCVPRDGALFIVGDPKQSIYRFKNADVAAYLNVERMFKEKLGEVLNLYKNFRSTSVIKEWFNTCFVNLLKESDEQAPYKKIPNIDEEPPSFTGVYKYDVASRPKEEKETDEYKVKELILKLYQNENYKINDHGELRTLDFKDFMIITPSKSSLVKYTKLFRQTGIPYFVEGNIDFRESKAFKMLVYFYGTVINSLDNRNLYSILKSNLFNISEKELLEIKPLDSLIDLKELTISNNLRNALNLIQSYAKQKDELAPSSLFLKIIENIEAFKKQGIENMEYVYFALELLKAKEISKEVVSHIDAYNFLEGLLEKANEIERCPSLRLDSNHVHLANLHKVKGLEAPVVILAHPTLRSREPSFRAVRKDNENSGYLFSVSKSLDNGSSIKVLQTKKYDETLKQDEINSSELEHLRLEYVAATRARNVLVIASAKTKEGYSKTNPWYDLLVNGPELNDIELLLINEKAKEIERKVVKYSDIDKVNSIIDINRNELSIASYKLSNPSKLKHDFKEYEEVNEALQKEILENDDDTIATLKGTMVHRLMEVIVKTNNLINKNELIDNIVKENGMPEFKDTLNNVYDVIHNGGFTQKGKAPKDILKEIKEASEVYSEVPFTYLNQDNNLMNGIIDLVYVKDNKVHIIDYKTNKDDSNLDELYKQQLEAYKKAIYNTLNKEVEDALIYHIDIND